MSSKNKRVEKTGSPAASVGANAGHPAKPPSRWRHLKDDRYFRFLFFFGLWILVFYILATRDYARQTVFPRFLEANSSAAGVILNLIGEDVTVKGTHISGNKPPKFSIEVARGCDAVEPLALFCAAVLASPVSIIARVIGVLAGSVSLIVLNFVRVVSLYWIGVHWRKAFDTMHLEVWQVIFIFLAIVFYFAWASQVLRRVTAHASA